MSEESIFREVNEDLRRDRMHGLWRRFGPWVIGVAVLVVVLVAVNEGWSWWRDSRAAEASDQLYAAFELAEQGDMEAASQALTEVEDAGYAQYPTLARFREAGIAAAGGDNASAVAIYDELAANVTEQRMRELALVLSAYALVDEGNVTSVASRVGTIAGSESALRNAAREALGLTQYTAGDLEAAMSTFEAISADAGGSMEQLRRVQVYVAQLRAQGAGAAAEEAAGDEPATEAEEDGAAAAAEPSETEAPAETPSEGEDTQTE